MDDQRMGDAANEMTNAAGAKLKETLGRAGDTVAAVSETAKNVAGQARSAGIEAGAQIRQAAQQAGTQGAQAQRYVSETTAAYPLTALLIAAAIGYGVARLTMR
ncbi:MAG: hypothetical protein WB710_16095 [Stellaceae bacterium]|jgi:hypothetical protein